MAENSENDLYFLAKKMKDSGRPMTKLFMWCGTEDFLYEQNVEMRDYLTSLGYDLTYTETPGDHQWRYWDEKIRDVLQWLPIQK